MCDTPTTLREIFVTTLVFLSIWCKNRRIDMYCLLDVYLWACWAFWIISQGKIGLTTSLLGDTFDTGHIKLYNQYFAQLYRCVFRCFTICRCSGDLVCSDPVYVRVQQLKGNSLKTKYSLLNKIQCKSKLCLKSIALIWHPNITLR